MVANTNTTEPTPVAGQNSGTPLTIREALAEARKYVGPDGSLAVEVQVWDEPNDTLNQVRIWSGADSMYFGGPTLRAALNALIDTHSKPREQFDPEEAERLAAEAHQIIEAQH